MLFCKLLYCLFDVANCTCDIRTEIDNTLHTICTGPSTAPCRCDENMCEVCMYACMYVCMYAGMHVCMHAFMHVCMYVCKYVKILQYVEKKSLNERLIVMVTNATTDS